MQLLTGHTLSNDGIGQALYIDTFHNIWDLNKVRKALFLYVQCIWYYWCKFLLKTIKNVDTRTTKSKI